MLYCAFVMAGLPHHYSQSSAAPGCGIFGFPINSETSRLYMHLIPQTSSGSDSDMYRFIEVCGFSKEHIVEYIQSIYKINFSDHFN